MREPWVSHDPAHQATMRRLDEAILAAPDAAAALAALHAELAPVRAALAHLPRRPPAPPELEHVRRFLEAHPTDEVPLEHLASLAGMSRGHLIRAFREAYGTPPHAYRVQLRVHRAKELIAQGVPLADAAVRTGFYDQSHLARHFKRLLGVPPGRFLVGRRGFG